MIKNIYKQKGWTATSAIVRQNRVEVKLAIDHRYNFYCAKCRSILKTHSVREICVRDLPIADKDVTLFVDTMQGYCAYCKRYLTLRPEICHPSYGYTWRLMRLLSRFLVHTSARFLQEEYSCKHSHRQSQLTEYLHIRNIAYKVHGKQYQNIGRGGEASGNYRHEIFCFEKF